MVRRVDALSVTAIPVNHHTHCRAAQPWPIPVAVDRLCSFFTELFLGKFNGEPDMRGAGTLYKNVFRLRRCDNRRLPAFIPLPKKGNSVRGHFPFILLVSVIAVNHCMDCYFNNTFYTQFQGANAYDGGMAHSRAQIKEFFRVHQPLFYLAGISFVVYLIGWIRNYKDLTFKYSGNLNLLGLIITTLVIYFMMGRSNGQWMAYQFQLMSPFFILCVINVVSRKKLLVFVSMPFILLTLTGLNHQLIKNPYSSADNWIALKKLVASHKNILNSPLIIPFLIEYQRPIYDSGQTQFAMVGTGRQHLNTKLFPPQPEIAAQFTSYTEHVHEMIREKKFDLLILTAPSFNSPLTSADASQYYREVGKYRVRLMHSDEVLDMIVSAPRN